MTRLMILLFATAWLLAGCSTSTTPPSALIGPPSDLLVAPTPLMATGGDPEKAPSAMRHNGAVLLGDRDRLIRWQAWWDESTRASANKGMMRK